MAKGSAKFRLEGEDATAAAFKSALGTASKTARQITGIFTTAFAGISVAAIAGVATQAINTGDELNKAAIKAGITGKVMSELAYAAKMADIDLGSLSTGLKFMQKNLSEATSGSKAQRDSLQALGLTFEDLKGMRADEQFELLAERIHELKDPADRARAATELFGKAGADLLPLFEQGAAGIRAARVEAERLGISFSDEQIAQLAKADDAVKKLSASWAGFAVTMTAKVAPALTDTLDAITATAAGGKARTAYELQVAKESLDRMLTSGADSESIGRVRDRIKALRGDLGIVGAGRGGQGRSGAAASSVAPPGYGDDQTAAALDYIRVTAKKMLPELLSSWNEATRTGYEREVADYREKEAELRVLRDKRYIDEETYQKRLTELVDETLPEMKVGADRIGTVLNELGPYTEEALRGIQQSFFSLIRDPFEAGLKGLSVSILSTFRDVIAQMAATKLSNALVGQVSGSGNLVGGLLSGGLNSLFGGFKAEGGPLQQGKWYVAGENGPEPVWGGGAGAFASGYGRGSAPSVVINMPIDMRGSTPDAVAMMPAVARAASDDAVTRVRAALLTGRWRR